MTSGLARRAAAEPKSINTAGLGLTMRRRLDHTTSMKSIHIRNVDPQTLQKLMVLAKMHHRSMQGELKAILDDAVKKIPEASADDDLDIVTVETGHRGTWKREDYN